jgi:hypothetical protein
VRGGLREVRRLRPVDGHREDLLAERARNTRRELAEVRSYAPYQYARNKQESSVYVRTIFGVVHRDPQFLAFPQLLAFQILLHHLVDPIFQILAVVRHTDHQETNAEYWLALRKWHLALLEPTRRPHFPQTADEPAECLGRASDDERLGSVMERDAELRALVKVLVRRVDMLSELLEREAGDGQHGAGRALAAFDHVLCERGLEREHRERLLPAHAAEEEPADGLLRIREERLRRRRRRDGDGGHDALRVARGTRERIAELLGRQVKYAARDEVLRELREADERQAQRHTCEVRDGRARDGAREPAEHVHAVRVVCGRLVCGNERREHFARDACDEWRDVWCIDVVERLELVEVNFVRALPAEEGVEFRVVGSDERRDGSARNIAHAGGLECRDRGIVAGKNALARGDVKAGGERVDILRVQMDGGEVGERRAEHGGARGLALRAGGEAARDMAQEAGVQFYSRLGDVLEFGGRIDGVLGALLVEELFSKDFGSDPLVAARGDGDRNL